MKKIGILSLYYKNSNYGGVLQSFALQYYLSKTGYDCKQISYVLESGYESRSKIKRFLKPVVRKVKYILNLRWNNYYNLHNKPIFNFADKIPHTRVVTSETIKTLSDECDIFICGSDQIWNPLGWQKTFFLDFLPVGKNKISYSASIARNKLNEDEKNFIYNHVNDFIAVSIRENNLANDLNTNKMNIDFEVMPDPCFLLTEQEWKKLACDSIVNEPYIFAYFLGEDLRRRNEVIKYANKHNIKILFIPYLNKKTLNWDLQHKDYMIHGVGPKEFLSLIMNAEMVLTDSFHGAVFSIIFNTPFYCLKRFKDGDINSMNSRIDNLLETFNLDNRNINDFNDNMEYLLTKEEIENINKTLHSLKTIGSSYLSESILKCK